MQINFSSHVLFQNLIFYTFLFNCLYYTSQESIFFQAIFFLISIGYSTARPQIVREVIGAENKAAVLSEFGGISILRQSLPDFQLPQDFNVEVESQVLVLTKPKDRDAKRREKAEKRIQVPRTS